MSVGATRRNETSASRERILAGALFVFGFLVVGVTSVFTATAANTLFLLNHDSALLAYCYVGFALVVPLVGLGYMALQARFGLRALVLSALALDVCVLLCFRVGFLLGFNGILSFGLKIWYDAELVLTSLVFWGAANQLLTLRQGKRLFGIIGAGDPTAVVLGGLTTPLLMNWFAPADLLFLSAAGSALGMVVVVLLLFRFPAPSDDPPLSEENDEGGKPQSGLWGDRYVRIIFILAALSLLAYFFVDNALYAEAQTHFDNARELASFFGWFAAGAGLFGLVNALFVAGPLMTRFGVQIGVITLPALVLGGALLAVGAATFGDREWLFAGVIAARLFDFSLRGTIDKSSMLMLYQPFAPRRRLRVQTAVESLIEPTAAVIAAILLLVLMGGLGWRAPELMAAVIAVTVAWLATARFVYRKYLGELHRALATRRLGRSREPLVARENVTLIRAGLASKRPSEVIYCLSLLEEADQPLGPHELLPLLDHPAADLRIAVAGTIERRADARFADALRTRLVTTYEPRVQGALLAAYLAVAPERLSEVMFLLDAPLAERRPAMFALLRHGGEEALQKARARLRVAARAEDAAERRAAALVLAEIGLPHMDDEVLSLLDDADEMVRRAALQAAARLDVPALWIKIIAHLETPRLERAAQAALVVGNGTSLAAIEKGFAASPTPLLRVRLIETLGRIGGADGQASLLAKLALPERRQRLAVLTALARVGRAVPAASEVALWKEAEDALAVAAWALAARAELVHSTGFDSLCRALAIEARHSAAAIFNLLACLFPAARIADAWDSYRYGGPDKRAYAIESIEPLLPSMLRPRALALIEPLTPDDAQSRLIRFFHTAPMPVAERLADIVSSGARVRPWTAATALFAAHEARIMLAIDPRVVARRFDDPVVHEMLALHENGIAIS